jgi:hypothetical protein
MTKRLIFSSWTATPTAIASLLSHEASRKLAEPLGLPARSPPTPQSSASVAAIDWRTDWKATALLR